MVNIKVLKNSKETKYVQLYYSIRNQIINGALEDGDRLPSIRNLSSEMSLSKTTVENAYQQLFAEGYIISKPQSGYYVNYIGTSDRKISKVEGGKELNLEIDEDHSCKGVYDFRNEYADSSSFDFSVWKKHINYVLNNEYASMYHYGNQQGEGPLRKEIIKYIYRTRGIPGDANLLVVGAGVSSLIHILATILLDQEVKKIAFESPGYISAKNIFENHGYSIEGLDAFNNPIEIEQLKSLQSKIMYVSPSHQFPTGQIMGIRERIELIKWAREVGGYIIEDDYNSELRYEGQPIEALKGMDNEDCVIYIGAFSTVLIPSIRISYMLLPKTLMERYKSNKKAASQSAATLDQLALARMMNSGDFEKHIRKIRKQYAKKRELVIGYIKENLKDMVTIKSGDSGHHILIELPDQVNDWDLVNKCFEKGVLVTCIQEYEIGEKIRNNILVLNYRGIAYESIEEGVKRLSHAMSELKKV